MPSSQPLPGEPQVLGRYHLGEPIGGGPTGQVFRAKIYGVAGFERQFALKRFHETLLADEFTKQALQEAARAYAHIEHPRIARLHEHDFSGLDCFVAVELIPGLDAARLLSTLSITGKSLSPGGVLGLLARVARAIGYAHGRNALHLGICPTNIILTPEGDAEITDFGFLPPRLGDNPAVDPTLTARLPYLAPEQFQGRPTSAATDVFQLAVVGCELLTGNRTFQGRSGADIAQAVCSGNVPSLNLPPAIFDVFAKALAVDPHQRFADADAFAGALNAAIRAAPQPGGRGDVARTVKQAVDDAARNSQNEVSGAVSFPLPAAPNGPNIVPMTGESSLRTPPPFRVRATIQGGQHAPLSFQSANPEASQPKQMKLQSADFEPGPSDAELPLPVRSSEANSHEFHPQVHDADLSLPDLRDLSIPDPNEPAINEIRTPEFDELTKETFQHVDALSSMEPTTLVARDSQGISHGQRNGSSFAPEPTLDATNLIDDDTPLPSLPDLPEAFDVPTKVEENEEAPIDPALLALDLPERAPSNSYESLVNDEPEPHFDPAPNRKIYLLSSMVILFVVVGGGASYFLWGDLLFGSSPSATKKPTLLAATPRSPVKPTAPVAPPPTPPKPAPETAASDTVANAPPPTPAVVAPVVTVDASPQVAVPPPTEVSTAPVESPVVETPIDPSQNPPPEPGKLVIESDPPGALVYIDGALKGKTPVEYPATRDTHKLALLLTGYKLHRDNVDGSTRQNVKLTPVSQRDGPAGIKIRCRQKHKDRYYAFLDGEDTGELCPSEKILTTLGSHKVQIYDAVNESTLDYDIKVTDTGRSLRLRVGE